MEAEAKHDIDLIDSIEWETNVLAEELGKSLLPSASFMFRGGGSSALILGRPRGAIFFETALTSYQGNNLGNKARYRRKGVD